jgi:hypothetical protein
MAITRLFSAAAVAAISVSCGVALLNPAPAAASQLVEGTYRFDFAGGQPSSFDSPDPGKPYSWMYAIRSACPASGCVATSRQLDANNPTGAFNPGTNFTYREINGRWQGNAFQGFACHGQKSAGNVAQTFEVKSDGTLVGTSTDSAPGCQPITRQFSATRVGDLPSGVDVPDPNTV